MGEIGRPDERDCRTERAELEIKITTTCDFNPLVLLLLCVYDEGTVITVVVLSLLMLQKYYEEVSWLPGVAVKMS